MGKIRADQIVVLFTCEHGGNEIPAAFKTHFRGAADVLKSHRGWDPGALELAERFAKELAAPLYFSTVSRLLVELNRSLHHRSLFSQYTRNLSPAEKQAIVRDYYLPHRQTVEQQVAKLVAGGKRVLHVGVHSFTPELDGEVRRADIGLLYDPRRNWERAFCAQWQACLKPVFQTRKNYPYLGTSDGFTTYLRTRFTDRQYAGVELEVNQRFAAMRKPQWSEVQGQLWTSLQCALSGEATSPR